LANLNYSLDYGKEIPTPKRILGFNPGPPISIISLNR
jgi:hypothetical protein